MKKLLGKIRVKRRDLNYGSPIATRKEPFRKNDYVEWQISYKELNDLLCKGRK